jgi:hypothetical protein
MNKTLILLLFASVCFACQNKSEQTSDMKNNSTKDFFDADTAVIVFYNVENLFDTIQSSPNDTEYLPHSIKSWDSKKYNSKINNLAKVIANMGGVANPEAPHIIGLAEVENLAVLKDLVANPQIAERNYQIVHFDSADPRGIETALLYNPAFFSPTNSQTFVPYNTARQILLVEGKLYGEDVSILVNHWASRLNTESGKNNRIRFAQLCKHLSDSIAAARRNAKIIIMGDFNDNPDDTSLRAVVQSKRNVDELKVKDLFNPFWQIFAKGQGSTFYQRYPNMYDQIILSAPFLLDSASTLRFHRAEVFQRSFMTQKSGKYKGEPLRSFSGDTYQNGYSDHYPVVVFFTP